jgi:hypothetical protein
MNKIERGQCTKGPNYNIFRVFNFFTNFRKAKENVINLFFLLASTNETMVRGKKKDKIKGFQFIFLKGMNSIPHLCLKVFNVICKDFV